MRSVEMNTLEPSIWKFWRGGDAETFSPRISLGQEAAESLETRLASMSQARRTYRLLATSTSGKERLRRSAIERNVSTGLRTKMKALLSISEQPKSAKEIGQSVPRSYGHLQRVLRSLTGASLATRDQRSVTAPAIYRITEVGRRYILQLDTKLRD